MKIKITKETTNKLKLFFTEEWLNKTRKTLFVWLFISITQEMGENWLWIVPLGNANNTQCFEEQSVKQCSKKTEFCILCNMVNEKYVKN